MVVRAGRGRGRRKGGAIRGVVGEEAEGESTGRGEHGTGRGQGRHLRDREEKGLLGDNLRARKGKGLGGDCSRDREEGKGCGVGLGKIANEHMDMPD